MSAVMACGECEGQTVENDLHLRVFVGMKYNVKFPQE